ncbi:MAG TPA: glycosyltransferase family 2 protein [Sphingomicrobium sp.]|nr:glycosyltransferase family 2 protein [Sphingomicrobium sp.]
MGAAQGELCPGSAAQARRGRDVLMPAISVILPVHNRADVLPRAIDSVLAQEFEDFELIVVDDGSSDESGKVVESYKDTRIRLIRLDRNRGGNVARNEGIRAAHAPLIAFLDSDDRYLPNKLGRVVAHFDERRDLDLLVDSFIKVQPPGSRKAEIVRRNPVINDRELFRTALFTRQLWKATPAIAVRREAALKAPFDESLRRLQDFDFLIRLSEFASCASTDEVLWVKYWDAAAISAQDNMISANIELVRRHPEYLRTPAYRPGLAYALRLSAWRRLKKGDLAGITRDVGKLAEAFGRAEALRLSLEAFRPRPALRP